MMLFVMPELARLSSSDIYITALSIFIMYFSLTYKLKFTCKNKYLYVLYTISEYICKFALVCLSLWLMYNHYIGFLFRNTGIVW